MIEFQEPVGDWCVGQQRDPGVTVAIHLTHSLQYPPIRFIVLVHLLKARVVLLVRRR